MISAKVIAHSTYEGASAGDELITMEVEFHRFILAEINTHRVLSRNYQSSRAVPVEKLLDQIRNNPAIPVHWGKNQRGMVAEQENNEHVFYPKFNIIDELSLPDRLDVESAWRTAAIQAACIAEAFHNAGYHKQIVNRLLEPFMWTRGVITATRGAWESVFALRCHPDAQPEFQALAYKIREAINASTPKLLGLGEWHLPYVNIQELYMEEFEVGSHFKGEQEQAVKDVLKNAIKISTSCCAQVSYRQLDDSLEKALKIYDMLNLPQGGVWAENPAHSSPTEHQACVMDEFDMHRYPAFNDLRGNFGTLAHNCWAQHRRILERGLEDRFIKQ